MESQPVFSGTITLGALIQVAGFLFSIVVFAVMMRIDLRSVQADVGELKRQMARMADALTTLAVQNERLNGQDRRIAELERNERG